MGKKYVGLLPAILLLILGLGVSSHIDLLDKQDERPNVILVTIEATPAEKLPCYGYHRNTTPNLCRFAENATRYENAYTSSTWTPLSFAGISTGKYPFEVGVYSDKSILNEEHVLLSEYLRERGYRTFINPFIHHLPPEKKFLQGYDRTGFDVDKLDQILDESEEPVFIREHVVTPHYPYVPLEEYREERGLSYADYVVEFEGEVPENENATQVKVEKGEANNSIYLDINDTERQRINDIYDDTLRSTDLVTFDSIIEKLKESDEYDNSLIIFTADHGEMMGEHNLYGHTGPFRNNVNVPLIVKYPDQTEGSVSQRLASHIDIYPTVLDVVDGSYADYSGEGLSLRSEEKHNYVFVQDTNLYTAVNKTHKMVWCKSLNFWCDSEEMYFDISGASEDRIEDSENSDFSRIKSYIKENSKPEERIADRSEEIEKRLRELGYLN